MERGCGVGKEVWFSAGCRHTLGWKGIEEWGCTRKEKLDYLTCQWKWRRGWLFPPLATPERLNLMCLQRGFPSSPAAHGANAVMVRKPAVKMAPSHSTEWLSADLQVRAAQLTDKNKLLLLLAPRSQGGQESTERSFSAMHIVSTTVREISLPESFKCR